MILSLFIIAGFIAAILAGVGQFSFWWVLIPAFFAGSFTIANAPNSYYLILQANEEGRLGFFPAVLGCSMLIWLVPAAGVFWIARALS
jgi:hypothetical protein